MKRVSPAPRPLGHSAVGLACAVVGALVLTGCPGEIDKTLIGTASTTCDPTPIFTAKGCAAASICHDAIGSAAGFDMASPGWETHLVGVLPPGGGTIPSTCGVGAGPYLMTGVQPAAGMFIQKLLPSPPCGVRMPQVGGAYLTQTELDCVQKWANALVTAGPAGGGSDAGTD